MKSVRPGSPVTAAQQRPGCAIPGNTRTSAPPSARWTSAQRRPGRDPRQHPRPCRAQSGRPRPLYEGWGSVPSNTRCRCTRRCTRRSLNKGRGRFPATRACVLPCTRGAPPGRSTKARVWSPATLDIHAFYVPHRHIAQRRPGSDPRRHAESALARTLAGSSGSLAIQGRNVRFRRQPGSSHAG